MYQQQIGNTPQERFSAHPAIVEELKKKAQALGLWNMFLPKGHFKEGAGFSNLEYGLMAELLGKSRTASEATNCAAPDTGNMEVLAKYGNEAQKRRWLDPLLAGKIRSAFLMTEPQVASSDATNIELNMRLEGDTWVLNGQVGSLYSLPLFSQPLNLDPSPWMSLRSNHHPLQNPQLTSQTRNGGPQAPATRAAPSTS